MYWASQATGHGPCLSRISLHSLPLCHSVARHSSKLLLTPLKWHWGKSVNSRCGTRTHDPWPSVQRSAALPTELAGQLAIGLVPAVFHYTTFMCNNHSLTTLTPLHKWSYMKSGRNSATFAPFIWDLTLEKWGRNQYWAEKWPNLIMHFFLYFRPKFRHA